MKASPKRTRRPEDNAQGASLGSLGGASLGGASPTDAADEFGRLDLGAVLGLGSRGGSLSGASELPSMPSSCGASCGASVGASCGASCGALEGLGLAGPSPAPNEPLPTNPLLLLGGGDSLGGGGLPSMPPGLPILPPGSGLARAAEASLASAELGEGGAATAPVATSGEAPAMAPLAAAAQVGSPWGTTSLSQPPKAPDGSCAWPALGTEVTPGGDDSTGGGLGGDGATAGFAPRVGESVEEAEQRQIDEAIRASMAEAEAEASQPLFDAETAPEEFVRTLNAEIAAQQFARAEDLFAQRLERTGYTTV